MKIVPADELGDGDQFISFFFQTCDQVIQSLSGIFGSVVAEDDGSVFQSFVIHYP